MHLTHAEHAVMRIQEADAADLRLQRQGFHLELHAVLPGDLWPYVNRGRDLLIGVAKLKDFTFEKKLTGFAIKEPVFSFNKFPGVNKELGPEMKSTGEAIRFIKDLRDPYFRTLYKERSMHLSK